MKNLVSGNHTFEIVDSIPKGGYSLWNIGKNIESGYLLLVQESDCNVNINTLKVIKVKEAQTILKALGRGQNTIDKMEKYINRYEKSKKQITQSHVQILKDALEVLYTVEGVQNLV